MSQSPKSQKVYQLAVEFSQYSGSQNVNPKKPLVNQLLSHTNQLPKIIDVDEDGQTARKKSPFENIFNIEGQDHMKSQQLANQKSYNIVGKKEVKAYLNKLVKKKNILQRRNQSALSISRYSSSVKSQNQTSLYLNKEDVLSFIRPSQNQTQNQSQFTRDQQLLTMNSHKSSFSQAHKNLNGQISSLRRSKDIFSNYSKQWNLSKQKKTKFPSILDHISQYRSKVEMLQSNSLGEKKKFIKDSIWAETLRTQKNVDNFYNDKFVEKIMNPGEGFCLKGSDKLQKQMNWIDEKDKTGYAFAFMDDLAIKTNKLTRQEKTASKESKLGESMINRSILPEMSQSQKQRSYLPETARTGNLQKNPTSVMLKNKPCIKDVKNTQRSRRGSQLPQIAKPLNQPPVLSHFSTSPSWNKKQSGKQQQNERMTQRLR